ncbi:hypothetical protein MPTK2_1g24940 [Marchantia polymorpha subsp. ruderalis]
MHIISIESQRNAHEPVSDWRINLMAVEDFFANSTLALLDCPSPPARALRCAPRQGAWLGKAAKWGPAPTSKRRRYFSTPRTNSPPACGSRVVPISQCGWSAARPSPIESHRYIITLDC